MCSPPTTNSTHENVSPPFLDIPVGRVEGWHPGHDPGLGPAIRGHYLSLCRRLREFARHVSAERCRGGAAAVLRLRHGGGPLGLAEWSLEGSAPSKQSKTKRPCLVVFGSL